METKTDKNKERENKEQIKILEKEAKIAYRSGQIESLVAGIKGLQALDAQNRLAGKLMKKVDAMKKKQEAKAKAAKAKEYEEMLRKLLKANDLTKLKELAAEFAKFDPENGSARRWMERAEKLEEKLGTKEHKETTKEETEKKPGPLAGLFKKPEMPAPKPLVISTAKTPQPIVSLQVAQVASTPAPTGNIFTRMFGKKEEEVQKKSIIDTIVAKSEMKEEKKEGVRPLTESDKTAKPKDANSLLTFSRVFMNFCAVFIVLSALFLYVEWVDKENSVLGFVGVTENTGGKLYHAAQELDALKAKEVALNKEIELFKGGYDDKVFSTVQTIINRRINWPDIFAKINEVTNSVYELNDFFKYIEYNNYSFDAENGTIRVSGTLSDPLGRNLTKLVELEEAFKYYPKDKNIPDDPTQPYFTGFKEFTSFSKSLDAATGRYTSSFQLSFVLNK